MQKHLYNTGDRVKIKSYEWFKNNADKYGVIYNINGEGVDMTLEMAKYCGQILTIEEDYELSYKMKENEYVWTDSMIEGIADESQTNNDLPMLKGFKCDNMIKYNLPEGYEFVNTDDNGIYLKKIKPKYPTTYEDCCKVMGISYQTQLSYTNPDVERGNTYFTKEKNFLDSFLRLRICRNVYWKIAGEEMGLNKPWEFENPSEKRIFTIEYAGGCIYKPNWTNITRNYILVFPTEKMRDEFYENFKDLIEECKELL